MKVAILTMFSGLSATYSLVNVVADQIKMLLQAGVAIKVLVSESCPDRERTGIFLDERLEWVTRESYSPSERAYYEEHGRKIVDLMREDHSLHAKTIVRNQYNDAWICRNQLLPLLKE